MRLFSKHFWADKDIQQLIGKQLRVGVITSSIIVLLGGIVYLYRHGHESPDYGTFTGVREGLDNLPGILKGIMAGQGRDVIQLGVVLLIATPIFRIVFSVFAFLLEKDYLYVVITLIVLAVITFSMVGGLERL
ncbi:DUF1634 domain-containing protein [Chitinophaga flava]|uniref:DUF1634 domain-containing protein n=1 Tax=Chitinophaga flava TaxID=2259036 RepID=A0A365Y386_9BACT|nr:DUF1634 domain-containing protein [Chitinophaga flava]RBL92798.1 DUF1634 domain-containing protein [Chitinophaga flava]